MGDSTFIERIKSEMVEYRRDMDDFSKTHNLVDLIKTPGAIGWKVADLDILNATLRDLLNAGATQVHIGEVDKRFIATAVFEESITWGINVIKLMQIRQGSDDPSGLDHVDFYYPDLEEAKDVLREVESWEMESNYAHQWISLRFNTREAKFVDHSVLDVCIDEMRQAKDEIL